MEKLLNIFGLTTIKKAKKDSKEASKVAVENSLGEKPYQKILDFSRVCRKYKFKVVAVGMDEAESMASSRFLAENEYDLDMKGQNQFTSQFIPNLKQSQDLDLLK
jgi:hypothetical protein